MVSQVDSSVKFNFENGRLINAVKFHSSHHAPHAAATIFSIFETLKRKNLLSEEKADQFKDFSATLIPAEDTQACSRLLIQSKTATIHITTLKPKTSELLIQGLIPKEPEPPLTARIVYCLAWFMQGVLTLVAEVFKSRQSYITLS